MIKNYLISAWRNMMRSKLYTLINIFCLSVGITGAVLIVLYINHELSYDTHHQKHERIFRLDGKYTIGGQLNHLAITPFPLGPALKLEFSQVEEYVRIFIQENLLIRIDDKEFLEDDFAMVDTTYFDVFTHRFIHGQAHGALTEPNTAVLTASLSNKYFGDLNPVGYTFNVNQRNYQITGVIEDFPDNSHLKLQCLLTINQSEHQQFYSLAPEMFWAINQNYTYVLMNEGTSIDSVLENMEAFNDKYIAPGGSQIGGSAEFAANPLRKLHLTSVMYAPKTNNRSTLLIFSMVAMFLIIIAAVNYTNLATARSSKRAREIAMRKVTGATRSQLIFQFLSESLLLSSISLVLSLLLVEILLPGFNSLADKSFSLRNIFAGNIIWQIIGLTVLTGFLSGIYPSFFLSNLKPVNILKSATFSKTSSGFLRKALVIFQFGISIILVAGTLTVRNQLRFLQEKPLGFNPENSYVITIPDMEHRMQIETLENMISQNPNIIGTAKSLYVPAMGHNMNAVKVQSENEMVDALIGTNFVDSEFLDLMEITIKEGRGFDKELRGDINHAILINEAAARQFGWHEEPIGKTINWQYISSDESGIRLTVVGVMKDFNFQSLKNPVEPIMLILGGQAADQFSENLRTFRHITVRYNARKDAEVMAFLEETVRAFDPVRMPNIVPLSHGFSDQFGTEERQGTIFAIFALVCIIISFLGLFGLASFLTEQRKKEVGIRKVLGSSGYSILILFYREFLTLVLIAAVVAGPVVWFLMEKWLQDFVYHISMNVLPIVLASTLAVAVAVITVSYHTLISSRQNPVDAIRAE
ncbi:MAG: ABC transporter permease [Bacteroidales bacterium]|nr:ABC transporter permease [Bacteroidales bacterium]